MLQANGLEFAGDIFERNRFGSIAAGSHHDT
jgi:hypothetical protein